MGPREPTMFPFPAAAIAALLAACAAPPAWARGPDDGGRSEERGEAREAEDEARVRARFRTAVRDLERARRPREIVRAAGELAESFESFRPHLRRTVRSGSPRARQWAVKILGENGDSSDLRAVTPALADRDPDVRLAAVQAAGRLGPEALPALLDRLPREPEANVRKAVVRTVARWEKPEAVPALAEHLGRESEEEVRHYVVAALQKLTGEQAGDDPDAWREIGRSWASSQEKDELLRHFERRRRRAKEGEGG